MNSETCKTKPVELNNSIIHLHEAVSNLKDLMIELGIEVDQSISKESVVDNNSSFVDIYLGASTRIEMEKDEILYITTTIRNTII